MKVDEKREVFPFIETTNCPAVAYVRNGHLKIALPRVTNEHSILCWSEIEVNSMQEERISQLPKKKMLIKLGLELELEYSILYNIAATQRIT